MTHPRDLMASYSECRRVACRAGSNFYPCFLLLRPPRRRAMEALYAFMRYTDDLVDREDLPDRSGALSAWRSQLQAAFDGADGPPQNPPQRILAAVADTAERFEIPRQYLHDVIDGVEMDLSIRRYESFDELSQYCHRVAGVVGLACLRIWGFSGEEPSAAASACGLAFQMTNILRDLREDAQRGRLYLPLEDLRRFDYAEEDLIAQVADRRFLALMDHQIRRTKEFYRSATPLAQRLTPEGRRMFLMMIRVYYRLLQIIQADPVRVLSRRVRVGRPRKLQILLRSLLRPSTKAVLP